MEKKWFKSALAMLLVIAMVAGVVPNIPDSVTEAEAAYTANGTADVTIFAEDEDGTGRFPDVTRLADDSLVAVCYWNGVGHHAPFAYGDPMGSVKIAYGSADGKTWSEPQVLITPEKLAEWGLGVWYVQDSDGNATFYYNAEEAEVHGAQLAVEARDPNLTVMNDGTLLLTFYTRLPDECKFNGYTFEKNDTDFAGGRTYIMYSKDNGLNWSNPTELDSQLLSRGCFKRGNIAVYSDNQILIPLYGSDDVQSNALHGSCVLAELNADGTWSFLRETRMWGADGSDTSTYTWETEHSMVVTTLNGQEVTYDLVRSSGNLLLSYDRGETWQVIAQNVEGDDSYFEGAGEKLQQPSVCNIEGTNQLFFTWTQAIGTLGQRNVYGKIYTPGEDWSTTSAVLIYKHNTGGGNDVGDPTGIQLANGELFTIYYDVAARSVGAVFNTVDELKRLRSEDEINSEATEWKFYDMTFEDATVGDSYLIQEGDGLWMSAYGTTTSTVGAEDGNQYLNITTGTSSASNLSFWFNNISSDVTMSFDFKMPNTITSGWQQLALALGVDSGAANIFFNNVATGPEISFSDSAGNLDPVYYGTNTSTTSQKYNGLFTAGADSPWYSVKVIWDDYWVYVKVWEKDTVEPESYTFRALNSEWNKESKIFMKCTGGIEGNIYLDNIVVSKRTDLSIVDLGNDTLGYAFDRDVTYELPSPKVTWSSSDPSVVSIDETGKMTYISEGMATITATCDNLTVTREITVEGSWKFHEMDFEDEQEGDWSAPNKYGFVFTDYNSDNSVQTVVAQDDNHYLAISHSSRATTELQFDASSPAVLTFDFKMPTTLASGWAQLNIGIGNASFNPQWQFGQGSNATYTRLYDTAEHNRKDNVFTTGEQAPWYTAKFVWDHEMIYMMICEKGKQSSPVYTCEAKHSGFAGTTDVMIKFATNEVTCPLWLDNIVLSKVTDFSIVDAGSDTLAYAFERDVTVETPTPEVVWSSSDTSVANIDQSGNLTYVGVGTTIITATCDNLTATKEITVNAWEFYEMDFEDDQTGKWTVPDKSGLSVKQWQAATQTIIEENGNKFLELAGTNSSDITEIWFDVSTNSVMTFDIKMPTALTSSWGGTNIALGNTNYDPMWQFVQSGSDNIFRLYGNNAVIQAKNDLFAAGSTAPWYSVKFIWEKDMVYVKVWEKGTVEPTTYTLEAQNTGFANTDKAVIKFVAGTSLNVYLDNIAFSKITNFSIVDDGSNTLSYAFDRDVTTELPVPNVTWTSSNEEVVKIDETTGVMTYVGAGTATITATCDNLAATKEIGVCEVNFDMQGHGGENSSQYLRKGDKVAVPTSPTEENYTFNGWYTEVAGRNAYNFDNAVNGDITIYAKWTYNHNVYNMDFEDASEGDYLIQDGNTLWMDRYNNGSTTVEKDVEADNQYLVLTGPTDADSTDFWFNNISTDATISFDFKMPNASEGWDRLAIAVGGSELDYSWKFEQWQGSTSVKYCNEDGTEQTQSNVFEIGSWYSVKLEWHGEWISAKIWKKDVAEPAEFTFISKNANFATQSKVRINYVTTAGSEIQLDNIRFYKESNYLGGDVNGDGVVDVRDLVRLKKHVSGAEHTWGGNCDVDNYGTVDVIDLDTLRDTYLLGKGTSMALKNALSGKYVSILGDSISTFAGISDVAGNNTTTEGYTPEYDGYKGGVINQNQTYWGQIIEEYNMNLLVNNACGANKLTWNGTSYLPDVSAGYIRAEELAANTGTLNGTKPDIIFMHMGTNDYIGNVTLGDHTDATYESVIVDGGYKTPETFTEAYIITLEKMQELYPDAEVFCFTLMPSNWNTSWDVLDAYNARIREIVANYDNVTLVDVAHKITTSNYTVYMYDNTHPNVAGMTIIANELEKALTKVY